MRESVCVRRDMEERGVTGVSQAGGATPAVSSASVQRRDLPAETGSVTL